MQHFVPSVEIIFHTYIVRIKFTMSTFLSYLWHQKKTNGDFNYEYENRFFGRMQSRKETGFRIHRDPHAAETTTPVKDAAY